MSNRNNSGDGKNKGGRAKRAPPFVVSAATVVSDASVVSAVCDQVSQVVPVQQVDDIDEVHQLDPAHQVNHKDDISSDIGATLLRTWSDLGATLERPWSDLGATLERPWGDFGATLGDPVSLAVVYSRPALGGSSGSGCRVFVCREQEGRKEGEGVRICAKI